jgi:hypothetical protein
MEELNMSFEPQWGDNLDPGNPGGSPPPPLIPPPGGPDPVLVP